MCPEHGRVDEYSFADLVHPETLEARRRISHSSLLTVCSRRCAESQTRACYSTGACRCRQRDGICRPRMRPRHTRMRNTTRTGLSKKSVNASKHIQSKRGSGNERTNSCKESLGQLPRAALHVTRGGAQSRNPHKRTGGANTKIEAECDGSNVARRTQTIQWTEHRATIEPQTQKSQPTTGGAK